MKNSILTNREKEVFELLVLNKDILIEISKQWGAETKDNFDKINDIDFRAIFRYKMYQKYNKSEIT